MNFQSLPRLILSVLFLAIFTPTVPAQDDNQLPKTEATPLVPPTPAAQPMVTPPPRLIPESLLALPPANSSTPSVPPLQQLDQEFERPPLSPALAAQREHQEWRRLLNTVRNDEDLRADLRRAEKASTDLEKRKLLGAYYRALYQKILARATPEMVPYLKARRDAALGALPQPRVRPSLSVAPAKSP